MAGTYADRFVLNSVPEGHRGALLKLAGMRVTANQPPLHAEQAREGNRGASVGGRLQCRRHQQQAAMLKVPVDDTVHSHRINSPSRHSGLCVSPLFTDPTSTAPLTTQVPQPPHPQPLSLLTPVCTFPSQATPSTAAPLTAQFQVHRNTPPHSRPRNPLPHWQQPSPLRSRCATTALTSHYSHLCAPSYPEPLPR